MRKTTAALIIALFVPALISAQSDDELFGAADGDFFTDDGIVELDSSAEETSGTPADELGQGILFRTGSVKIGGNFDLSLASVTPFRDGKTFGDSLHDTLLVPKADAQLTVDARPSENLRLYMKSGIHYPYTTQSTAMLISAKFSGANVVISPSGFEFQNLFYIKELFSDFNAGDYAAFRFGKQTVTWGTGYFFSPADVINLTAIDPENPTEQVEGPLALRAQFVFPGTQNAVWAYIIPDNSFNFTEYGVGSYIRNTALALKGDIVLGGWEFGLGGWYKYKKSPRLMLTATGTIFRNIGIFAEGVAAFGKDNAKDDQWAESYGGTREMVFQATAGFMRYWKNPKITLAAQYYYNGQETYISAADGLLTEIKTTRGSNLAASASFGKIFTSDLSATVFAMMNFDSTSGTASAMLKYSPIDEFSVSMGPYITWTDGDRPVTAVKILFDLGKGKF